MIKIGEYNELTILRTSDHGLWLSGDDEYKDILLPKRFVASEMKVGDLLKVFIARDSEDRIVATLETPKIVVGGVGVLEVTSVSPVGAFLNWGLSKDLLLPFSEQLWEPKIGDKVVVYVFLDKASRPTATMKVERNLKKIASEGEFKSNQKVNLILIDRTDLGYKAVVNQTHVGIIYASEVFRKLSYGLELDGYISKVRQDGKIDLLLNQMGHHGADETITKIIELLSGNNKFYPINDKTDPDQIYKLFGVSKKKYKIALGTLYKSRKIDIKDEGIYLIS